MGWHNAINIVVFKPIWLALFALPKEEYTQQQVYDQEAK